MRRILGTILVLTLFAVPALVSAQQAGNNIPVLPVVTEDEAGEKWWQLGDGFLQRQVEPTIAASTLNPDHLLTFFNDYRAIDAAQGDVGLGEGEVAQFAKVLRFARLVLPPPIGSLLPDLQIANVTMSAASEAWIGGSRSYDGGLTWSGFFVPGASWDPDGNDPQVSKDTPIYGLEAATDPVLAPGPCGTFYLTFVAFTRGDESNMVVARYRDTNDFEGGETFVYDGMTIVETGNNAEHGYFLDKPDIEVDVLRPADPDNQCGHRVYVTYSTFNGLTKDEKVQTKMNFASATVLGDEDPVFDSIKISKNFNQNQGSAIAVDPRAGEPGRGGSGGGTVYVFWRHFFDPDAIIVRSSTNYGARWSNPEIITTDMAPFDQPTIPAGLGREAITFRSNAFPTAAVTDSGTVVAAWQERVDGNGSPDPSGTPRIIVMRSVDGGDFEGLGVAGDRIAIDAGARSEPFDPGLATPATQPHPRPSGPQVMPKLSFGGGQLMLSFYESRGWIAYDQSGNEFLDYGSIDVGPPIQGESWMSGYDRVVDLRAALLNPQNGELGSPSIQVSRYPISGSADLAKPDPNSPELGRQDLADVAPINPPCSPDHDYLLEDLDFQAQYPGIEAFNPCVRRVNRINSPHSAVGTSAFAGDYNDLAPYVQFVFDTDPGVNAWRWATQPGDVSSRGFHSVWTDNRHLIPPQNPNPTDSTFQEWAEFPEYGAPNSGAPSCANPGSRNADVLTARINSGLVITAPTTYKQLDAERSFPFSVANQSNENRFYEIETITGAGSSKLNPVYDTVDAVRVMVFPYSSTSQLLTVQSSVDSGGYGGPFKVQVREIVCGDPAPDPNSEFFADDVEACGYCSETDYSNGTCQFGSVVFNAFEGNDPVGNLGDGEEESFGPTISNAFVINYNVPNAFVINDGLDNAFVINKSPDNAFVINDSPENAFVINAFVINAFVINQNIHDVIDVVWEMEPGTANTASSYLPLVNVDFAEQFLETGNYAFQLIVDKPASYGTYGLLDDCNDETFRAPQGQILSNVVQDPTEVDNAFVINKRPENAFVINDGAENAFVINAFVINSTFPMAPDAGNAKRFDSFAKAGGIDDSATKADPPSKTVRVTLRAYQLKDSDDITGNGDPLFNPSTEPGGWMPSNSVADVACGAQGDPADCFTLSGPDLQPIAELVANASLDLEVGQKLFLDPVTVGRFGVTNDDTYEARGATVAVTRGTDQLHGFFLTGGPDPENPVNLLIGQYATSKALELGDANAEFSSGTDYLEIPSNAGIQTGTYTLVYKVDHPLEVSEYDETNNTIEYQIEVTDQNEPPIVTIGGVATPVNEGAPVQFSATVTDEDSEIESVVWDFGDSTTDTSGDLQVTHTFVNDGDFTVTLTATDDRGAIGSASVHITVENTAPSVVDQVLSIIAGSSADVVLSASDAGANDALEFSIVNGPTVGGVSPTEGSFAGQPPTATVEYTAPAETCGMDSFDYFACDDGDACSATATVAVTISPLFSWFFDGLFDPYTPPAYTANTGSTVPLNWKYVDANGVAVKSGPQRPFTIRVDGWPETECGEHSGTNPLTTIEDAGSSGIRYRQNEWKFNWQTKDEIGDPLAPGCYEVTIVSDSGCTIETGGPFAFQLE